MIFGVLDDVIEQWASTAIKLIRFLFYISLITW